MIMVIKNLSCAITFIRVKNNSSLQCVLGAVFELLLLMLLIEMAIKVCDIIIISHILYTYINLDGSY